MKTLGVEDAEDRLPTVEEMMQFNAMVAPPEEGQPAPTDDAPAPLTDMDQAEAATESAEDMVREAEQSA